MGEPSQFLGIIPVRGGSKRLPNKNARPLRGKPLLAWTIESGLGSKYVSNVLVSSDSDQLLEIAANYPVTCVKRPDSLATDEAQTIDVIRHCLESIEHPEFTILLQGTSPLRTSSHIDAAIDYLSEKNADAVISVCKAAHSPLWTNILPESMDMSTFLSDEVKNKRSQDLGTFYQLNGAIYICRTQRLLEENTFFLSSNIFAYEMDRESSIDIDDELDFKLAELILSPS